MYGEGVPQIMDAWLVRIRIRPRDSGDTAQTLEALLYDWPLDRLADAGLEQPLLALTSVTGHRRVLKE